jgi:hypothetical protein
MQAVVQYNRQQVLAGAPSAAAGAAAAAQAHAGASEQQEQQQQPFLVVGYVMKSSREDALAKAGMLHVLPQQGMCFMPVDLDTLQQHSSAQQQQQEMHVDILLHKGSDELVPLSESSTAAAAAGGAEGDVGPAAVGVRWSPRLMALQSWLNQHPRVCVVDPFKNTAKVRPHSAMVALRLDSWDSAVIHDAESGDKHSMSASASMQPSTGSLSSRVITTAGSTRCQCIRLGRKIACRLLCWVLPQEGYPSKGSCDTSRVAEC